MTEIQDSFKEVRIFIKGLPLDVSEDTVKVAFKRYGSIVSVSIRKNPSANISFATVQFSSSEEAQNALQFSDGMIFEGSTVNVLKYEERKVTFDQGEIVRPTSNITLIINDIPSDLEEGDLRNIFSDYSDVSKVSFINDPKKVNQTALVIFEDNEKAMEARGKLNGVEIKRSTFQEIKEGEQELRPVVLNIQISKSYQTKNFTFPEPPPNKNNNHNVGGREFFIPNKGYIQPDSFEHQPRNQYIPNGYRDRYDFESFPSFDYGYYPQQKYHSNNHNIYDNQGGYRNNPIPYQGRPDEESYDYDPRFERKQTRMEHVERRTMIQQPVSPQMQIRMQPQPQPQQPNNMSPSSPHQSLQGSPQQQMSINMPSSPQQQQQYHPNQVEQYRGRDQIPHQHHNFQQQPRMMMNDMPQHPQEPMEFNPNSPRAYFTNTFAPGHASRRMHPNLFVFHLPQSVDDHRLFQLFSPFGEVISVKVIRDDGGASKGYGFVLFKRFEEAVTAIKFMDGAKLEHKYLKVSFKNERGLKKDGKRKKRQR